MSGSDYSLVGTLGSGAFGTTYEAIRKKDGKRVAVKRVELRTLEDWKSLELFEREARVLRGLNHPGIPGYIDFEHDAEGQSFNLVQELAPGRTLRDLVEAGWRPDEAQVQNIAEQLLDILVYLQGRQPAVFHRDIKPDNVVLGDDGRVSLVDFGAVRDMVHTISGGTTIVGTFGYMAPEQLRSQADARTDLYGLGTTLLFLLTRREPGELPQSRMRFSIEAVTSVSRPFSAWLSRLVEPFAEDRFVDARAALRSLRVRGAERNVHSTGAVAPMIKAHGGGGAMSRRRSSPVRRPALPMAPLALGFFAFVAGAPPFFLALAMFLAWRFTSRVTRRVPVSDTIIAEPTRRSTSTNAGSGVGQVAEPWTETDIVHRFSVEPASSFS